ncbi:hypothetical protein SAMN05444422_10611 [Halobiforma haloterrestris]|uniref:Uncharacterized protein n=1 Tax=Natronobacterium haloterrestre TaxID=148448 RepID=A0A1I1HJD0_NATHA|nr:hypothetical protein SAMN05444422_10611 [Halobiforma haloterrestris]
MAVQMFRLFAGALGAMIPLSVGGVFLYAFFEFAEEMA